MDREPEELQFLSLFGIYRESTKLIFSHRRLFSHITATLILPLSLLFLAHIHISHLLFSKIDHSESALEQTPSGSPSEDKILSRLSSEWSAFILFKGFYLVFLLIFSLLSTSAVVYTIASIFTSKDITFKKIFTVVPKVWKRLMITFLWAFLILLGYNGAAAVVLISVLLLAGESLIGIAILIVILIVYFAGLVWISVVWHVASVVSVLEDSCGIAAVKKSKGLVKGKLMMVIGIFLKLNVLFGGIELGFRKLVAEGGGMGVGPRVGYGVMFWVLMALVILFGLVVQTVVYFVCKSYHHESIDKSSLADHLEVYLGEYVPLKGRDVQLEQYYA